MGHQNPLVRSPVSADERRMNNRITYTVARIDAAKELEYSRLQAAPPTQHTTQTNTQQQNTAGVTSSTRTSQTTTPTFTPSQPQLPQRTTPSSSKNFVTLNDGPFIVQVASSGVLDLKQPDFIKITTQLGLDVKYRLIDGKYKYFVGFFGTLTEAKDAVEEVNKLGVRGAWARNKY
jgi:hypothetical protein